MLYKIKNKKITQKIRKFGRILSFLKDLSDDEVKDDVNEDLDLGHEDNEPHMLKGRFISYWKICYGFI